MVQFPGSPGECNRYVCALNAVVNLCNDHESKDNTLHTQTLNRGTEQCGNFLKSHPIL